ncbi:MAG: pyridoxamine 5'-phosphate oxidase family protein, partial [Alphaproteobacteria bacterium]
MNNTKAYAEPFDRFSSWLKEAEEKELNDHNAMALATVSADGQPSVRMVLLKGMDERGFVFYTNHTSRKAQEILATGKVS